MSLQVIPAIDMSGGDVVQLRRGKLEDKTVYGSDAAATAKRWERLGAKRLHVVDIDGAIQGAPRNREAIEALVKAVGIPVQLGGGIRDMESVRGWVRAGVERVVIGTAALTDDEFLRAALAELGERVVVALDVTERELRLAGWREGSGMDIIATARRLAREGVKRFLCTDIGRDGMLQGPNLGLLSEVATEAGVPVIASGGVGSLDDLRALGGISGIEGAIIGTALYSGAIDLPKALSAV